MSLEPTTVVDAQRPTGLVDDSGAMLRSMDGVNGHGEQGAARIIEVGNFHAGCCTRSPVLLRRSGLAVPAVQVLVRWVEGAVPGRPRRETRG